MELYAGLDLHSRNTFIGILDKEFNPVFKKRVSNDIEQAGKGDFLIGIFFY